MARPAEAASAFEAALKIEPSDFDARFGLALLAFEAGDYDGAATTLAPLPPSAATSWLLARISAAGGDFEQARATLERVLPGLSDGPRADALLMLAHALDRLGRPTEAFRAAMEGKAIQRRLFSARAAGHETETAKLKRLRAWFETAGPMAAGSSAPQDESGVAGHVLLVGFPRSGTTMLEQALGAHPEIVTLEEAPTLGDHYAAFLSGAQGLERLSRISEDEAARWRARYWEVVRQHGVDPNGRVFLDKAPAGTLNLPLVARLFPAAKVLFAVRDPRDVVLSCAMNAFQMNALTYEFTSLSQTAACYDAAMGLASVYRRVLPLAVHEVRYEKLVAGFAQELTAITGFIGVPFDPATTDVAASARGRAVRTPSAAQVREGLNSGGVERWRAYRNEIAPVAGVLAPWVEAFGYPAG
jgi:hypothetical protein